MKKKPKSLEDLRKAGAEMAAPKPEAAPEKDEMGKMMDGQMDLDHLLRAEEIKQDPSRMEYVHKAHEKKMGGMRSIADLKMAGQALGAKKLEEEKAKPAQPRIKKRYPERA
jgi:hypothetical protein